MANLKVNAAKIAKSSRKRRKRLNNCGKSFSSWKTTNSTWTMNVEKKILSLIGVESCLSRTRKVSTLELLAPAKIRYLSNSLPQKYLTEFQQKLDSHCEKAKVQQKKALDKRSANCEAHQDNLKTQAARNAEQEQSIFLFKQEMADFKVNAAKIAKQSRKA